MTEPEPEYGLVMPFLPVASKGGPYDDRAYTAGYEMGLLDAVLLHARGGGTVARVLHAENRAQADLLAMRHGWRASFTEHGDGWIGAAFIRLPNGPPTAPR